MPVRKAEAKWNGNLREGSGTIALESGAYRGPYDFRSRFAEGFGGAAGATTPHGEAVPSFGAPAAEPSPARGAGSATNPEELIAAAHAGCLTMAMTAALTREGITATEIHTTASVTLDPATLTISRIELVTRAKIPGIDPAKFEEVAQSAKAGCPVSKALAGVAQITLDAKLE